MAGKISKITIYVFVMVVVVNVSAMGKIVFLPLEEMVAGAKLIIVGKAIRTEKTAYKPDGYGFADKAIIKVEEVIKGKKTIRDVEVYYFHVSTEPGFDVDERMVLFLFLREDKYFVFNGHGGKVSIRDNEVSPFMSGEEKETVQGFIRRIKTSLGREYHD